MNALYIKSVTLLLIGAFFAWTGPSFAESTTILTKSVNKASRTIKKSWSYETGQIFGSGVEDKIGDYVLYEQANSPTTKGHKSSSYTMTILFQAASSKELVTLQGSHDYAAKHYTGSVTGASSAKTGLIGAQVSGDDKTGQLTLTHTDTHNTSAIQSIACDPYRKLDDITINKVKNKLASDLIHVNIKLIPSMLEGFPNDTPPLDSDLMDKSTPEERILIEKQYIQSRQELDKSVEAFIHGHTEQIRDFAKKQDWIIQVANTYFFATFVGQLTITLPVEQLPLLQNMPEVKSIDSETCVTFAVIGNTGASGCVD